MSGKMIIRAESKKSNPITISPHGLKDFYSVDENNGADYGIDTLDTRTCGIQEAINEAARRRRKGGKNE